MEITHSRSLELIAKTFGFENWNILSAKIDAAQPRSGPRPSGTRLQRRKLSSIVPSAARASTK